MSRCLVGLCAAALVLSAIACTPWSKRHTSPLRPAQMSPDSVVLEVFFVRFPFGDSEANGALWQEGDEQHFPPVVRRELVRNGFRVGVVGPQPPAPLARLLALGDQPPGPLGEETTSGDQLGEEPAVSGWHSQCRAGRRLEIAASKLYPELCLLIPDEGGLCGESYRNAQGILAVTPELERDGRVRLQVVPELHYGQARQQPVPARGGFRLEVRRPRRVFDQLGFAATLTPGQMVLVGCLPNRPGSLGHHFLTQVRNGQREQKLLVIRLAQTQHDDLVVPVQEIPLDDLPADE
ncbi:MAG TPA: hypothetical protein EYP56_11765 [Planctomycetaceae bacterium]|nr:hypothetical protein [Planctomycetaceae bacterium]